MSLTRLTIEQFRNIERIACEFTSSFNLIHGQNGSGKTSLLEAIYYLGHAKSFRTHLSSQIIAHKQDGFTLFGELEAENTRTTIGISRNRRTPLRIKADNEPCKSVAELANLMPLLLIDASSYQVLDEGPKYRRRFLDWGLFHVEQSFLALWKQFNRVLTQRNSALKAQLPNAQVSAWDDALVQSAESFDSYRKGYFQHFQRLLGELLAPHALLNQIKCQYLRGWPQDEAYLKTLKRNLRREYKQGYTAEGPQRADLLFLIDANPASEVLSRGQQKVLVSMMRLAQGILCAELVDKTCIYLIDDLPSELDQAHREFLMQRLAKLNAQVFVTGVESKELQGLAVGQPYSMFHVEHGKIR